MSAVTAHSSTLQSLLLKDGGLGERNTRHEDEREDKIMMVFTLEMDKQTYNVFLVILVSSNVELN